MSTSLYQTKAINYDGIYGYSYIKNGIRVVVSHPLNNLPGTNPEELLGLSFVTCLNSTLKTILKEQKVNKLSKAICYVSLHKEETDSTYYFKLDAYLSIEGLKKDEIKEYINLVEKRCPVSKLLINNTNVNIYGDDWSTDD